MQTIPAPFPLSSWTSKIVNPLNQKAVLSTMSSIMPDIMLFMATVSVGWLVWSFWYRVSPAKSLPGIPLVEFDGDNSRERYTSDIASLIGKGYDTVRTLHCRLFVTL